MSGCDGGWGEGGEVRERVGIREVRHAGEAVGLGVGVGGKCGCGR